MFSMYSSIVYLMTLSDIIDDINLIIKILLTKYIVID